MGTKPVHFAAVALTLMLTVCVSDVEIPIEDLTLMPMLTLYVNGPLALALTLTLCVNGP